MIDEVLCVVRCYIQICRRKGLVSQIRIVLKRKSELTMCKIVGRCWGVIKPLEEIAKGEETLVVCTEDFRVG